MEFKHRSQRPLPPRNSQPKTADKSADNDPKSSESVKTVEIKLSLPNLSKLPSRQAILLFIKKMYAQLPKKKLFIIAVIIVVLVVGYFAALSFVRQYAIIKNSGVTNDPTKIIEAPDYVTLLPEGKTVAELGGWKRVSPPKGNPVFAYADKINSTPISVSQQPIPDSFKQNDTADQVAQLAKEFNATNKLDVDGTLVYIGTSAKGPQSVIFTKNDLLILVKAQAKIDDKAWEAYVKSLK